MKALLGILSVFMAVVISVTTAFCVTFNKNQDFKDIVTEELESSSVIASLEEESLKIDECEKKINDLQNKLLELDETQVEEKAELEQKISSLTTKLNSHISAYNSLSQTVSSLYKIKFVSYTVNNLKTNIPSNYYNNCLYLYFDIDSVSIPFTSTQISFDLDNQQTSITKNEDLSLTYILNKTRFRFDKIESNNLYFSNGSLSGYIDLDSGSFDTRLVFIYEDISTTSNGIVHKYGTYTSKTLTLGSAKIYFCYFAV